MQANTRTLQEILAGDHRYMVPPYQRPYVWNRKRQWIPLWDDVVATVNRLAAARDVAHRNGSEPAKADTHVSPHFLGAIVLEQMSFAAGDIDRRSIVDGQQRLTTIQLLVRGIVDAIPGSEHMPTRVVRARLMKLTRNAEDVIPDKDSGFKVWPRRAEREAFMSAMHDEPPEPSAGKFQAARSFFAERASAWLSNGESVVDPFVTDERDGRVGLLAATVRDLLKLVVIDLDRVDDAQVIFEVLNARNTPLTAADLVKNLLFMKAERHQPNSVEDLYDAYWQPFDNDSWWSKDVGLGHAARPRLDRFLGDFLIAKTQAPVSLGQLYGTARNWISDTKISAREVLSEMHRYAQSYASLQLHSPTGLTAGERRSMYQLQVLGVVAADPLLLWLLTLPEDRIQRSDRERCFAMITSYLVRRMISRMQTRGYTTVFVEVLAAVIKAPDRPVADVVQDTLSQGPQGNHWPSDEELQESLVSARAYGPGGMNQRRVRLLLGAVDRYLHDADSFSETVEINYSDLTIEHIMPQKWREHWPLDIEGPAAQAVAGHQRDHQVQRIGNLTLLVNRLNSSVSNGAWVNKRASITSHSVLKLNGRLVEAEAWSEATIRDRAEWLASIIANVWPRPEGIAQSGEMSVDTLDDETVDIVHLQIRDASVEDEGGHMIFSGSLASVLGSLGVVSEKSDALEVEVRTRLVANGQVETLADGRLRLLDRPDESA